MTLTKLKIYPPKKFTSTISFLFLLFKKIAFIGSITTRCSLYLNFFKKILKTHRQHATDLQKNKIKLYNRQQILSNTARQCQSKNIHCTRGKGAKFSFQPLSNFSQSHPVTQPQEKEKEKEKTFLVVDILRALEN
jgi:hypothetical protein